MAAKSFEFPLGPEDRWLIASVSTLAKLVEPVGPLAAGKRRWLTETRRLLKEASEFLTQKLPVGVVEYDELAAVTGRIEDTLLDLGAKLAGPEMPDESESERERNQRKAESEEAEAESEEADEEDAEGTGCGRGCGSGGTGCGRGGTGCGCGGAGCSATRG